MNIAVNPLMALLSGGGAAPSTNGATQTSPANGFSALLGSLGLGAEGGGDAIQAANGAAVALPQIQENLQALVQKATSLLQSLDGLNQEGGAPSLSAAATASVLNDLTGIVEQISQFSGDPILANTKAILTDQVPDVVAAVEGFEAGELSGALLELGEEISPEQLIAAVVQVAQVLQTQTRLAQTSDISTTLQATPDVRKPIEAAQIPAVAPKAATETARSIGDRSAPTVHVVSSNVVETDQATLPVTGPNVVVSDTSVDIAAQSSFEAAVTFQPAPIVQPVLARTGTSFAAQAEPVTSVADELGVEVSPEATLKVFDAVAEVAKKPVNSVALVDRATGQTFELPKELLPVVPYEFTAANREAAQQIEAVQNSQPARAAESQTARFASAIVSQVNTVTLEEGVTKVELTPRGLGALEIELATNSDGSLSVVVRAENANVLNSLREERAMLAEILPDASQGSLDFQEFENSGQERSHDQANSGIVTGSANGVDDADADVAQTTVSIGNGQLDLMT